MAGSNSKIGVMLAQGLYWVTTAIAIVLVWGFLIFEMTLAARRARVTTTDLMLMGAEAFALAAVVYFAGWGWRWWWTGRTDHFFVKKGK